MVTVPKRNGRFELWLGGGCVLAVCLAALLGSFRKEIHAGYLFWRFNNGADEQACELIVYDMLRIGKPAEARLRGILVSDPRELHVLNDKGLCLTVVNNRPHRVLLRAFSDEGFVLVPYGIWREDNWPGIASSLRAGGHQDKYLDVYRERWFRYDPARPRLPPVESFQGAIPLEPGEKAYLAQPFSNIRSFLAKPASSRARAQRGRKAERCSCS